MRWSTTPLSHRIGTGILAALFLPAMALAAIAQTPDFFVANPDMLWGDATKSPAAGESENHLAKCLAHPDDRVSCYLARHSTTDGGTESALSGALETVIVDYSDTENPSVLRGDDTASDTAGEQNSTDGASAGRAVMIEADILFEYNSTQFVPGEEKKADQLAAAMLHSAARDTSFVVIGHTDAKGSQAYNCRLSEQRARALADALVARGVGSARLAVVGAGEFLLKDKRDTESSINRRVGFAQQVGDGESLTSGLRQYCAAAVN